ncbi:histidine kinase [Microbacterium hominis]|uniref:Histidine kinase n=1 Tax=Microbacterium hominis TaxID=162426 RepID=A0A7D4PN19_9MICO|nr:histidine kinase [Microbacterium hominis]QKJ19975.1 histidine kinase [Microbacterium hominis]
MNRTRAFAWTAATLLGVEAAGLLAIAVWQVVALVGGDVASLPSALALIVITLVGVTAVASFAYGAARGLSWGRSGGIVTQLLILAVALGALTGAYAAPGIALALAAPAVVTLVALVLSARRSRSAD